MQSYSFAQRDLLRQILALADPTPAAYLEDGIRRVELVPSVKDGRQMVHLINTTELYLDAFGHAADGFPAVCDLTVAVRCAARPREILLEPSHVPADFTYDGAYAHVRVPEVKVHEILCIER